MVSKPYRKSTSTDVILKNIAQIKELEALNRLRNTPRPVSAPRSSGGSAAGATGGGTGNFLPTAGGTMVGRIAFHPSKIDVLDGRVNLDPSGNTPKNSSYIQVNGETNAEIIKFIDGAENDGQFLIYQGNTGQVQSLLNASLPTITNIVGDGDTTVTVTVDDVGTLANGFSVNIVETDNFNLNGAIVANLSGNQFDFERGAGAINTTETSGIVQDGNIVTSDGETLVLDGTVNDQSVPVAELIFDNDIIAGGAWRVLSTTGGKLTDFGTLTGNSVIDFNIFNETSLTGRIDLATANEAILITFLNANTEIRLHMRIYLLSVNPAITMSVTFIDDDPSTRPWAENDFLDIDLRFDIGNTAVIEVVKKNNNIDTGGGDVAPGIPGNIYAIGNTDTTAEVSWDQPEVGSLPITYTVSWSLDAGGNATTGPTTPVNELTGITENLVTAGLTNPLVAGQTYFFWVRGVNSEGSGDFAGPQQTNTEGTNNPTNVDFTLTNVTFNSAELNWDNPTGTLLFTAFRTDSDGSNKVTFQTRKIDAATIIDTNNIEPSTEYKWTLETYNEFNVLLGSGTFTETTAALPQPVLTLTTTGRKLNFSVPIPAGINICQVVWDIVDTFDSREDDLQMVKTVAKSTPQTVLAETGELLAGTEFFVQARFQLNSINGPFNATQSIVTGTLSIPLKPEFDEVNITAQNFGIIKIGVDFANSTEVGETAVVTARDSGSVDPNDFESFPGMVWSRNDKPTDDLRDQEDEVLVVRGGGGFGAAGIITVVAGAVTAVDVTFGGQDYVNGQRILIYDDDDSNYRDFQGTAIVSGGRLTGVSITDGGDFFDDQHPVFLVGFVNSGIWTAGNQLTFRVVAVNASGESPSDTENHFIGNNEA